MYLDRIGLVQSDIELDALLIVRFVLLIVLKARICELKSLRQIQV